MPNLRFLCSVGAALATTVLLSVQTTALAGEDEIVTTISLKEFKEAFGLYAVRQLIDSDPDDGVSFTLNKLDENGKRIIWSDPDRNAVDVSKSFISFTVETQNGASSRSIDDLDAVMDLFGRKRPDGRLVPSSCDLSGSGSSGIDGVTCGDGPTVSPS